MRADASHVAEATRLRRRLSAQLASACPPGTAIIVPASSKRFLHRSAASPELERFYLAVLGLNAIAGHAGLPVLQLGQAGGGPAVGAALLGARGCDRALLDLGLRLAGDTGSL
jgi:hypothetical protein